MKQKGFTLIELMIVVAIVAFLAAISIPNYFRYLAKAQQTEVALNLAALHAAQQILPCQLLFVGDFLLLCLICQQKNVVLPRSREH